MLNLVLDGDRINEICFDGTERAFEFLDVEGGIRIRAWVRFIGRLSLTGLAGLLFGTSAAFLRTGLI